MLDLIARLESATGPDRNLDADIALTQGWTEFPGDNWIGPDAKICVPAFTSSIDAALTLVPAGFAIDITVFTDGSGRAGCWEGARFRNDRAVEGHSEIGAIVVCIAALKARHAISVTSKVRGGQE